MRKTKRVHWRFAAKLRMLSLGSKSDIDLLIDFNIEDSFSGYAENFWQLEDRLKTILNREVDLLPTHTLRNPYFINEIEETKIVLYE